MVHGNYVVQDVKVCCGEEPSGGAERRTAGRRSRGARSAADLDLTLPPRRTPDGHDEAARGRGEPNLLRYAPSEEADADAALRRSSFARKPRSPGGGTDGSLPLPTIAEHAAADSFGELAAAPRPAVLRARTLEDLFPSYPATHKFNEANYFSKPCDGHKFSAKGTHPDSLYRVPLGAGERDLSMPARCYRLLRWPAALLAVCVALALFIYYVMPDSAESELLERNATSWEAGGLAAAAAGAGFRHRPAQAQAARDGTGRPAAGLPSTASTRTEIEFGRTVTEETNSSDDGIPDFTKVIDFHPVPMYPESLNPDVQYGNEKVHPGSDRTPKLLPDPGADPTESTLHPPYHQTKGDFAIYVRDEEAEPSSTEAVEHERGNFTSGHSKLFGLSVEEAERLQATTRHTPVSPTLPALPRADLTTAAPVEPDEGVSCRSTQLELCRQLVRYDLALPPLAPAALSADELADLVQDFERLAGFACNPRIVHFLCHVLEPECTTSKYAVKKPCRLSCEDAVAGCDGHVYPDSTLETLLDCSLYPEQECLPTRGPCLAGEVSCQDDTCVAAGRRCDGRQDCLTAADEIGCAKCNSTEYQCPRGECIPRRWLCDGYADCIYGEDETDCRAGPGGFEPHPPTLGSELPAWLTKYSTNALEFSAATMAEAAATEQNEAAESILEPRVLLPINALPHPTKVDRARVMETSKMHDGVAAKGEADSTELLLMSDTSAAARYYQRTPPRRRPVATTPPALSSDPVSDLLEDLEKMVDSEKWWESDAMSGTGKARSGTAHASPCPAGELRCVDGRCIMFSQLCDGHVDCVDNADEDNCNA